MQWKPFWLATQLDPQNDWNWVGKSCEQWRIRTGPIVNGKRMSVFKVDHTPARVACTPVTFLAMVFEVNYRKLEEKLPKLYNTFFLEILDFRGYIFAFFLHLSQVITTTYMKTLDHTPTSTSMKTRLQSHRRHQTRPVVTAIQNQISKLTLKGDGQVCKNVRSWANSHYFRVEPAPP